MPYLFLVLAITSPIVIGWLLVRFFRPANRRLGANYRRERLLAPHVASARTKVWLAFGLTFLAVVVYLPVQIWLFAIAAPVGLYIAAMLVIAHWMRRQSPATGEVAPLAPTMSYIPKELLGLAIAITVIGIGVTATIALIPAPAPVGSHAKAMFPLDYVIVDNDALPWVLMPTLIERLIAYAIIWGVTAYTLRTIARQPRPALRLSAHDDDALRWHLAEVTLVLCSLVTTPFALAHASFAAYLVERADNLRGLQHIAAPIKALAAATPFMAVLPLLILVAFGYLIARPVTRTRKAATVAAPQAPDHAGSHA